MKEPKLPPINDELKSRILDWYERADALNAVVEYARQAVLMERERCAGLCDNVARYYTPHYELGAKECAEAIRKG